MKIKHVPCAECRKHRRKCLRLDPSKSCSRCERLDKICEQYSSAHEEDQNDPELKELKNQVTELELTIRQLETQMRELKIQNKEPQQPKFADPLLQNLMFEWKCKIVNGTFQIETGIQNVRDLLNFKNPVLSYLSPISYCSDDYSDDGSITTYSSNSVYTRDSQFVMSFGQDLPKESLISMIVRLMYQSLLRNVKLESAQLILPPSILFAPNNLINELLRVYFICHNPYNPILHEDAFKQRFATLQDPSQDLMTLCICTFVCIKPCNHISYSARETRSMADYFYNKAKSTLMDQFDDMDKRLENMMAMVLLVRYCHMTLKLNECRQYVTMSYQLALDLRKDYLETSPPPLSKCFNAELHSNKSNASDIFREKIDCLESTNVDQELYRRHVSYIVVMNRIMDFMANGSISQECFHIPFWSTLYGESETTRKLIYGRNWVSRLYNHPFFQIFSRGIQQVRLGGVSSLSFEAIVKMEEIIQEWVLSMPIDIRMCYNLNSPDLCKKAIDQTTDATILVTFAQFHAFLVSMYYALLRPSSSPSNYNEQILTYVQQHSLEQALKSCNLLLYSVRRLTSIEDVAPCCHLLTGVEVLVNAIDVLAMLILSPNQQVSREARAMVQACFMEFHSIKTMDECRVPIHASPLAGKELDSKTITDIDIEYYDQYPQPWYALMYDLTHSTVHSQE